MATWAHLEHAIAFLTLGGLFALAYPRRTTMVCLILIGSAIIFKLLQTLTPDRHGTLFDASEKIVAGCAGNAAIRLIQLVRKTGKRTSNPHEQQGIASLSQ